MITIDQIQWELILGGLALFLFGIQLMGDGLTNFAGTKIRDYIEKYTSKPWKAILVGIILTAAIQSSTATTVIAISLVRAGLMRLDQAIGITMGANIGTTVTAVLIGLDMDILSYYVLFIGIIILMTAARKKFIYLSHIIIGFSLIFIGLDMMGAQLGRLPQVDGFNDLVIAMGKQPLLGLIGGSIITAIVQSSSAVIGIVQKLFDVDAIGLIPSIALILGANIGTCITAIIASIGGSLAARRASMFHIIFNIIGSIIFMILLVPYSMLIDKISFAWGLNKMMEIAVAHFFFNLVSTLLFTPFVSFFVQFMEKLIPGKDSSNTNLDTIVFDETLIESLPSAALASTKQTIVKMGEIVLNSIHHSQSYLITKNRDEMHQVQQLEGIINSLDTKITTYLLKIAKTTLDESSSNAYAIYMQVTKNLERISDLSQNLTEFYEIIFDADEMLSEEELKECNQVYELLIHNTTQALEIFATNNFSTYKTLLEDEEYMDLLEHQYREAHFQRLIDQKDKADVASSMYVDVLGTIERMADHAFNIATITINPVKFHHQTSIKGN